VPTRARRVRWLHRAASRAAKLVFEFDKTPASGCAHFMRLSDCILSPLEIIFCRCWKPVHTAPAVTFCEKFVAGPRCRYCCNGAQGIKTIRFVFWNLRSSCVNPTHLGRVTKMLSRQEGPSPRSANPRSLITHISQLSCSRFTGYAGKPRHPFDCREATQFQRYVQRRTDIDDLLVNRAWNGVLGVIFDTSFYDHES
jgi:hypothetical protein